MTKLFHCVISKANTNRKTTDAMTNIPQDVSRQICRDATS